MRIGFDIGGVLSKYPEKIEELIWKFCNESDEIFQESPDGYCQYFPAFDDVFFITDQHPKEEVIDSLYLNIPDIMYHFNHEHVLCADYEKYGNLAKAILIKELGLDIFIDDFDGYLQWDSSLGPQPVLLKVMPDAFKPYWSDSWKTKNNTDFGRRKYTGEREA